MKIKFKNHWRTYTAILFSVLAFIFIVWQRDAITRSIKALSQADWVFVGLSLVTFIVTVFIASGIVYVLKIKPLEYRFTLLVQTAGLFLGRISPANSGSLAATGRFLVLQKHSILQAGTVLAAAALATFLGNVLLTILALITNWQNISLDSLKLPPFIIIMFLIILFILLLVLLIFKKLRARVINAVSEVTNTLKAYSHNPKKVIIAIILGACLTLFFALTMMLIAYSLDVKLSIFSAIIITSLGSLGVAVTPLPGGAVGAEAALAASMVQFGVPAEQALAIALVYRFVTFWLPLLPGYIASQYALSKKII